MRIAYLDCFSGISGDMFLGALVDAGLRLEDLQAELAKLHLDEFSIRAEPVRRKGLRDFVSLPGGSLGEAGLPLRGA